MSVAAAALIAGTGFAYAQGTGTSRDIPSAGSTAQSAPSSAPSSATPMNRDDSDKRGPAAKTTQTEDKAQPGGAKNQRAQDDKAALPGGAKNQRAQDDMKAAPKGERSAQDGNLKGERSKTTETDNAKGAKDTKGNMNAQGREDRLNAQGREDRLNAEQKGSVGTQSQTTTGQVGAGAKLSTEQRTKITTVIREQRVQPVTNVNFEIRAGVRVPRTVSFHPLPPDVVTIYPEWRGYEYFLVNNQIVVVNPRTLEIVDVIDV
jgi:hypothetical protein